MNDLPINPADCTAATFAHGEYPRYHTTGGSTAVDARDPDAWRVARRPMSPLGRVLLDFAFDLAKEQMHGGRVTGDDRAYMPPVNTFRQSRER